MFQKMRWIQRCFVFLGFVIFAAGCASGFHADQEHQAPKNRSLASAEETAVILDPDLTKKFMDLADYHGSYNAVGAMSFETGRVALVPDQPRSDEYVRVDIEVECLKNPYRTTVECWAFPAMGYTQSRMPMSEHDLNHNPYPLFQPMKVSFAVQPTDPFVALLRNHYGVDHRFAGRAKGYSIAVSCVYYQQMNPYVRLQSVCEMKPKQLAVSWDELIPLVEKH